MGRKHSNTTARRPQTSKRSRVIGIGIDGIETDLLVRYARANQRDHEGWR